MSPEEILRKARLGLKSDRPSTREATVRDLKDLIAQNADPAIVNGARYLLNTIKPVPPRMRERLSGEESDLLRRIEGATWYSPVLGTLDGELSSRPSASFVAAFARSLKRLFDRLRAETHIDEDRASALAASLSAFAVSNASHAALLDVAGKFSGLAQDVKASRILSGAEGLLIRGDLQAALALVQSEGKAVERSPELGKLSSELSAAEDCRIGLLRLADTSLNANAWAATEAKLHDLETTVARMDGRFAQVKLTLTELADNVAKQLDDSIRAHLEKIDDLALLARESAPCGRRSPSLDMAMKDWFERYLASRATAISNVDELLRLAQALRKCSPEPTSAISIFATAAAQTLRGAASTWTGIMNGVLPGAVTSFPTLPAMTRDMTALAEFDHRQRQLETAVHQGDATEADIDALRAASARWPLRAAQIEALADTAAIAKFDAVMAALIQRRDWSSLNAAVAALPSSAWAEQARARWLPVVNSADVFDLVSAQSEKTEHDTFDEMVDWWRTWESLSNRLGPLLSNGASADFLKNWIEDIVEASSVSSGRLLARLLDDQPLDKLLEYVAKLDQLASKAASFATFARDVKLRSDRSEATKALSNGHWTRLESLLVELEAAGDRDFTALYRSRADILRARTESARRYADALLTNWSSALSREPDMLLSFALEAISRLWLEVPPDLRLIAELCRLSRPENADHRQVEALEAEGNFLASGIPGAVASDSIISLAEYAIGAETAIKNDWAARLEALRTAWRNAGDLPDSVWAGVLAAALLDRAPDLTEEREALARDDDASDMRAVLMLGDWPEADVASLEALRGDLAARLSLYEKLKSIVVGLPGTALTPAPPPRLAELHRLIVDVIKYHNARSALSSATTAKSLDDLRDRLQLLSAGIERTSASLRLPKWADADLLDRIERLGRSFNLLSDWRRSVTRSSGSQINRLTMDWNELTAILSNLENLWREDRLAETSGLAQSVMQEMWNALERVLGDDLPIPMSLSLEQLRIRVDLLRKSAAVAERTIQYMLDNIRTPNVSRDKAIVRAVLALVPVSPPQGKCTRRFYEYYFSWPDIAKFLVALHSELPGWVADAGAQGD